MAGSAAAAFDDALSTVDRFLVQGPLTSPAAR